MENLEFALKYDGMNLEVIKALFKRINEESVTQYVLKQATSIHTRKIWYLYEFLTKNRLPISDCKKLKYTNLLNDDVYFTAATIKSPRHAVNDNLLGNYQFCPFIRKTSKIKQYIKLGLNEKVKKILDKYESHLVSRASNYLYTKETMSSYQIEKEEPDQGRIARFVNLLQQSGDVDQLSKVQLIALQNVIVDPRFVDNDYRSSQNYVGENVNYYFQKIHYISPKPEDVAGLMDGLLHSLERMVSSSVHPVIVASAISFGFVYIHPFEDGNGRIHRFLIHQILARMQFAPKNIIFPISAVMLKHMLKYDEALEFYSKALLTILTDYEITDEGIMAVHQNSQSHYPYIDYTVMTEYLFACIEEAVTHYIENEIQFLINYDQTKKMIQDIVDMPDNKIDLFIKLAMQNNGRISKEKQRKFFSMLSEEEVVQLNGIIKRKMQNDS